MSQIQEIKQAIDIVQLISERLNLARSGTNWRGLCPFHSEKSPSFFVSEQLQRYKCFGCGESGDIFTFLQKYDGLTFAESLQVLADRAGITLVKQHFNSEDEQRARLLEILDLARAYYHYLLTEHQVGEPARQYLRERGVTQDSIKQFQLGFALPGWDGVLKYLHQQKKFAITDIIATGLVIGNQTGRSYDRFRNRVMFPLTDHRGRVVGFSGRVLSATEKDAKYINTPETTIYHKGQLLFGYSQLYQHLRQEQTAVVVEGEFDVISSVQAHVPNVVAVKGSALTEQHMRLLSRTVQKVILSFDLDAAGLAATTRAIQVAQPFSLELRVIDPSLVATEGKKQDPDMLARTQPTLWRRLVKSSISVYDFFIQAAVTQYDPKTPEGKRHIIDMLAPIIGQISHAVEYEFYVEKLAEILHVQKQTIHQDLQQFKTRQRFGVPARQVQTEVPAKLPPAQARFVQLSQYALFLLLHLPEQTLPEHARQLIPIQFEQVGVKQLLERLAAAPTPFSLKNFARDLADDLQQLLIDLSFQKSYSEVLPTLDFEKEWVKTVAELREAWIKQQLQDLTAQLMALEQKEQKDTADEQHVQEVLQRMVQIRSQIPVDKHTP